MMLTSTPSMGERLARVAALTVLGMFSLLSLASLAYGGVARLGLVLRAATLPGPSLQAPLGSVLWPGLVLALVAAALAVLAVVGLSECASAPIRRLLALPLAVFASLPALSLGHLVLGAAVSSGGSGPSGPYAFLAALSLSSFLVVYGSAVVRAIPASQRVAAQALGCGGFGLAVGLLLPASLKPLLLLVLIAFIKLFLEATSLVLLADPGFYGPTPVQLSLAFILSLGVAWLGRSLVARHSERLSRGG